MLDLQNYHPEEPRVNAAISVREGVLLSLVAHLVLLVAWLVMPKSPPRPVDLTQATPVQFVQMIQPLAMNPSPKNVTRETPPQPKNPAPKVEGESPEKILGQPIEPAKGADTTQPDPATATPPAAQPQPVPVAPPMTTPDPVPALKPGGGIGESLRNLSRFLRSESYDNPDGGQSDHGSDIQFDDKGIDFGPWLARFKAQIMRNWMPPSSLAKGHVVYQFYVLKNGTIIDIRMTQPSAIEGYNVSAGSALRLSSPTMRLPDAYPDDRILFTVTFHYNEGIRDPQ